jgi:hypothetical protein
LGWRLQVFSPLSDPLDAVNDRVYLDLTG